ncbi:MAG: hypothetical protein FWF76_03915 [Oscillospiraceae bacterium]|nr:hypothetical protein [Oscillospiraceae bacterium]
MKKRKLTALLLCLVMVLVACSQTQTNHTEDEVGEPEPKFIGSRYIREQGFFAYVAETLEGKIEYMVESDWLSDKIVIGRVESVYDVWKYYSCDFDNEDCWDCIEPLYFNVTDYKIVVYEIILGEEVETLILTTTGLPDCDYGLTKPEVGAELMLFLIKGYCGRFGLFHFEDSMFRVEDDGTVISFSDEEYVARFDGELLETLENEILEILDDIETNV